MSASIPAIDLSPFFQQVGIVVNETPTREQLAVAKQIDEACRHHGFVHAQNYGLTPQLRKQLFEASAQLFSTSNEYKKSQLRRIDPKSNMGYSPLQSESLNATRPPELKEAFNVRFPPAHTNDYKGCPDDFESTLDEVQQVFKMAAHRYALACALALNLPRDFFLSTLNEMNLCTIRMLHYPPCDFDPNSKAIRIGEHTDFGAFTILLVGDSGADGLQIKPVQGGEVMDNDEAGWFNVVVPPHSTVINTGALMARWTNDTWNATAHRVIVSNAEMASRDRYSIAFFVDPDTQAVVQVHDLFLENGAEKKYEPITGLEYLQMKLQEMMKRK